MDLSPLPPAPLEQISRFIADCYTGDALGRLFVESDVADVSAHSTKWRRTLENLSSAQEKARSGHLVAQFVQVAANPTRFIGREGEFERLTDDLNTVLAFSGLHLRPDGKLSVGKPVTTLSEAQKRATRLRQELVRRGVHGDALRFCRSELLDRDYFHAVLEATKSLADKVRTLSGLTSDSAHLVDEAFGMSNGRLPMLAFNSLRTTSERSEHRGIMNLFKGAFAAFRNPTAHEARIHWNVSEQDALDLLTIASLLHRRLDAVVPVPVVGATADAGLNRAIR